MINKIGKFVQGKNMSGWLNLSDFSVLLTALIYNLSLKLLIAFMS